MSRFFSTARRSLQALPSSPEMKSVKSWGKSELNNSTITSEVVGMTKRIVESSQPPMQISPAFTRTFQPRENYDPFDFSNTRMVMDKQAYTREARKGLATDPFERTGIDPKNLYCMPEILSKYISSTGQILPRSVTGCNSRNQKRLSDAIKTARACGLLSSTHKSEKYLPVRQL